MQTDTIEKKRIPLVGDQPPPTPETDMRSGIPTIPGATPGRIPLVVNRQPGAITRRAGDEPPLASERTPMSRPIAQPALAPAPTGMPVIPGTPPTGVMPTIAGMPPLPRPTPQDSQAAGKSEYQSGMPSITAKPFTSDYYQQEQEKNDYQKEHPWGSPVSAHPGMLGKIGHVAGEIGNVAGDVLAPRAMSLIPGTQLNREGQERQNEHGFEKAQQEETAGTVAQADLSKAQSAGQLDQSEIDRNNAQSSSLLNPQAKTAFEEWHKQNPDKPVADFFAAQAATKNPTNPFEAFAYGTPEERKAAQDFLTLEKRTGAQYRNPSEIDERYSLYKRDPDAYKSMFGNRGDAQDQANSARAQAQATRMLKYFDAQRKEIQNSFLMDDNEKQQQLSQIDQLEKPYQDAAQVKPRATDESDTIQVINPNGTAGTIPVSNIKKALSRGYKVAPNQ